MTVSTLLMISAIALYIGMVWFWRVHYSRHYMAIHSLNLNLMRVDKRIPRYFQRGLDMVDMLLSLPYYVVDTIRIR
jgi:hypothetical protein